MPNGRSGPQEKSFPCDRDFQRSPQAVAVSSNLPPLASSIDLRDALRRMSADRLADLLLRLAGQREEGLAQLLKDAISRPEKQQPEEAPEPYMVGAGAAMQKIFVKIRKFATSNAPALLTGESGTGKELVARAIHERSACSAGPFVPINCAALPDSLIAAELFGCEKGAFTGATQRRIGLLESAEGGTVFLDEIGDLPLETQVHLLRFLQERTIERIGSCKSITINTRVIAATNINLHEAVAEKRFREDLFYRLNVLTLALPPLRERGNDVRLLTRFFLKHFADELGRPELELSPEAEDRVASYSWPGNVRELIACIRRAVVMADHSVIGVDDLGLNPNQRETAGRSQNLPKARADTEASLIRQTLERNRFNIKQSAKELQVSRMTLYRLIQKHNIAIERAHNRNGANADGDGQI